MTLILGLETSCDETAAAVVDEQLSVHSNVVATQFDLHERYAGVVPEIASRAHVEKLMPVVTEALTQAGVGTHELTAIAVGHRPGLVGSLIVGVAAAKALAWSLNVPLIGVDHVEAHLSAAALGDGPDLAYPALGLVVSGGHTSLYRLTDAQTLERLGSTMDDAIGEAFDKAAVILGLGYPGGPRIDTLSKTGDASRFNLPRPTLDQHSLDFSFSGLKTALLYAVRGHPVGRGKSASFQRDHVDHDAQTIADFAASFQAAAVDVVIEKLERALHLTAETQDAHGLTPWESPPQSLIFGGGVSANTLLRERVQAFADENALACHLPAMDYCIDNAAMIAGHAHRLLANGETHGLELPVIATTRA
ncbi:MAG: tRNA (adenosine(37)-N6)-threonylcarbamoyltransferase complex transferase subunit TsaD [Planctomycetota bacterium]